MFRGNFYITETKGPAIRGKLPFARKFSFFSRFIRQVFRVRKNVLKGKGLDYVYENSAIVIRMCEEFGARIHIEGIDNLRNAPGAVVIAANHQSTLETLMLPSVLGSFMPHTYVVKKSLSDGFIFGPIMKLFGPIGLERNRKEPRADLDKVMKVGGEALANGKSVVIFPQGTRCMNFDPAGFNSIAVKLAKRAGVSVIPCAVKTDFWENGRVVSTVGNLWPERTVHLAFGEAVAIEGAGKKEQARIVEFIEKKYKGWTEEG